MKPRSSLEQEVYERLCEHILAGQIGPGDALVEAKLSAELGVSKTPVREALIRLQRDGLVEQIPYRGARLIIPSPGDVRNVCELRRWIEVPIARRLAANPSDELLELMPRNIASAEAALGRGAQVEYVAAVRAFSELMISTDGNLQAREVLERLRNKLALIANASRTRPGRERRSIEEHRAIYDAIAARDPDAAEQATRLHIESVEQDYLSAFESERDVAASRM